MFEIAVLFRVRQFNLLHPSTTSKVSTELNPVKRFIRRHFSNLFHGPDFRSPNSSGAILYLKLRFCFYCWEIFRTNVLSLTPSDPFPQRFAG